MLSQFMQLQTCFVQTGGGRKGQDIVLKTSYVKQRKEIQWFYEMVSGRSPSVLGLHEFVVHGILS